MSKLEVRHGPGSSVVGCTPGLCHGERREYGYSETQDNKKDLSTWVEHEETGKKRNPSLLFDKGVFHKRVCRAESHSHDLTGI